MADCGASVRCDEFEAGGPLTFRVNDSDCRNSSGQFRFDYQVKRPDDSIYTTDRTMFWTNEAEPGFALEEDSTSPTAMSSSMRRSTTSPSAARASTATPRRT